MKTSIHPKYYTKATVKCVCGKVFNIGSTKEKMDIEVCSNCHPLYTGQEKLIDTKGRVERFKKRLEKKVGPKASKRISNA